MNKCQCGGSIDESIGRIIYTPCNGEMMVNPCEKCGLLHWFNGNPLFHRHLGVYIYLKDEETVDENGNPVSLENKFDQESRFQRVGI